MGIGKSERAFRSISEAAEQIGVAQHVLRFWETRFPQLQPLKRGGNRRYYRPADMELLETIRSMLYDQGLTIRGAQLALAGKPAARSGARADQPSEPAPAVTPPPPSPVAPAVTAVVDAAALRAIRDRLAAALAA